MILTEETHYGINEATMEAGRAAQEEPFFGQEGSGNEVAQTRSSTPSGWTSNTSGKVSKLGAPAQKAGPNVLLKVMAGDEISAMANYYYQNPVTNSTGNNLTGPIITSLIQSILGSPATGLAKGNTTPIAANLSSDAFFNSITAPDANNPNGSMPKAYLTIIFFNEQFEYISEGSMALRVAQAGDGAAPLVLSNIKAPKNGYAYVYLSNESSEPVYFDDFKVADTRGRIIEENHYYAFGLKIAGISSRKFDSGVEGDLINHYLYNDKEFFEDAGLGWYDYGFRNYDSQIGRFTQLDPLTWDYPYYTPYQYAGNEPIANVDMDGLEPFSSVLDKSEFFLNSAGEIAAETLAPVVISTKLPAAVAKNSGTFLSVAKNFGIGLGQNLWEAVTDFGKAVIHIDKTISGVQNLTTPAGMVNLASAVDNKIKEVKHQWKTGGIDGKAAIIGAGVGEALQLFGGEFGEVGKFGKLGKVAEVSEEVGKMAKIGEGINSSAHLATEGVNLSKHLGQLEKYGKGGFKELANGRFRYYGQATLNRRNANSFRMVREWNPATGGKRTWFETLNPDGGVIQVRPEFGAGIKTHYLFNGTGGYLGKC